MLSSILPDHAVTRTTLGVMKQVSDNLYIKQGFKANNLFTGYNLLQTHALDKISLILTN